MLGPHLYVHLGENGKRQQYLSFRENPLLLVWLLYWYGKPLGYRWRGFRSTLGGCKFLARVVLKLFYYRLFSPTAADVLKLPVLGQLCIRVRNGYKVFDFRRNREQIIKRLLKEPRDYIESCRRELKEEGLDLRVHSEVRTGHHLTEYKKIVEEHSIQLLVLNTKD